VCKIGLNIRRKTEVRIKVKLFSSSLIQVNTFTYCFSLYFLNAVSQGFKIADQNDQNWLYFSYEIDTSWYYLDKKGFLGNYTLGKRATTHIESKTHRSQCKMSSSKKIDPVKGLRGRGLSEFIDLR
jgi:hypothetical protein